MDRSSAAGSMPQMLSPFLVLGSTCLYPSTTRTHQWTPVICNLGRSSLRGFGPDSRTQRSASRPARAVRCGMSLRLRCLVTFDTKDDIGTSLGCLDKAPHRYDTS